MGCVGGMEEALVTRAGLAYRGINTGQIRGINPGRALTNVGRMAAGVRESLAVLRTWSPDVCLVTGGYVCAPVALACRMRKVPVLIYLPDMTPGASIRSLSRLADRVAVSFVEVAPFFGGEAPQGKAVVTGYPVREELIVAAQDRQESRRKLAEQLKRPLAGKGEPPLVLVWGGSQGSRNINESTWQALPALLPKAHVLHVVGKRDWPMYQEHFAAMLPTAQADRYHPVAYLHEEMALALAAADITVARAGASSLGEFPVAGLPSVLVPLPHAGVNQSANAELLAGHGAATIIEDGQLQSRLAAELTALLDDEPRRLDMENAAKGLAKPDAAAQIAHILFEMTVPPNRAQIA